MKFSKIILAMAFATGVSSAKTYNCVGAGFEVDVTVGTQQITMPTHPPKTSQVRTLAIKGERILPNPAYMQIADGRIYWVKTGVIITEPIDLKLFGGISEVSTSKDGTRAVFKVDGQPNLGEVGSPDYYWLDHVAGELTYVVDASSELELKCN